MFRLCKNEDVPISERAAWSASFHRKGKYGGLFPLTLEDFVQHAERYATRLAEIDAALKEPNAPILGFITGDGSATLRAVRYAYRVGDGSGLTYSQQYDGGVGQYRHDVRAEELPLPGKKVLENGRNGSHPLISSMAPGALVETALPPEEAVPLLHSHHEPTKVLVIGSQAVNALFQESEGNPRSEMMLGHAVRLGFQPEF